MNGSIWNFLTITYTITITSAAFQVAFGAKVWLQLVTNNSCYLDLPFPSRTSSASTAPSPSVSGINGINGFVPL
jgi:hypothetical protein